MVRSNGFLQFRANNVARAFSRSTTSEQHNTTTSILEGRLEQAHRNAESDTGTPKRTLVIRNGEWVTLELLEDVGNLEFGLLDRKEESRRCTERRTSRLRGHVGAHSRGSQTEHLLDLLCRIVFASPEHIGFGTFGVTKFVDLRLTPSQHITLTKGISKVSQSYHCTIGDQSDQRICGQQGQAHNQRVLQGLQAVILLASINDVYEYRGCGSRARQLVLDRRARWV